MEKQSYFAPEIEVLEIKLEKGFADSVNLEDPTSDSEPTFW